MSVSDEVVDKLSKALPTLLEIMKNRFGITLANPLGGFKLLELEKTSQGAGAGEGGSGGVEEALRELLSGESEKREAERKRRVFEALSSIVGTRVTAPVMTGVTPDTMVFVNGYVLDAKIDRESQRLFIEVRLEEPVFRYIAVRNNEIAYKLNLNPKYEWGVAEAIPFVVLMAINKHVEDAVLSALQLMGYRVDRLREAVRRTKLAYEAWFTNH